ncbi:MAG: hypothetical protein KIT02_15975 [Devosia sp.]|uniref:hypothetical protein n=1 Tax=Devosia sp. TaxID=1871048 RepID=UPI0024CDC04C|nr:hypothetical protein [Devosia sp.]UYN99387.1 MAG: hypothetical protein KIT02_15975 [Devosia sp.]
MPKFNFFSRTGKPRRPSSDRRALARQFAVWLVAVAAILSMGLHHAAMAAPAPVHHAPMAMHAHDGMPPAPAAPHTVMICCGLGMCLSGLPVSGPIALERRPLPMGRAIAGSLDRRWTPGLIERPPKFLS